MDSIASHTNHNVINACARLLYELDIFSRLDNEYSMPYANYIMSWPRHIPINTIIIGQNPYPQKIYPEYGAAFAYDDKKCRAAPKTVEVLSHDVHNFDGTDIDMSVRCFRDSWRLIERGIIFINETVLDALLPDKYNTRRIKEMQAQIRALEVVISESILAGQQTITCIGMGIPAASMTSIIRSWSPKDLVQMKVMTCKNPAARDIGDLPSHEVTIGKPAVSKVLSRIVKEYSEMPPPRVSAAEKRREDNKKALQNASENIAVVNNQYEVEIKSFEDRLRAARDKKNDSATLDDLLNSLGSLRNTVNNQRNAIGVYTQAVIMCVDSIPKTQSDTQSIKSSATPSNVSNTGYQASASTAIQPRAGPRRRVSNNPSQTMQPVDEVPESSTDVVPQTPSTQAVPQTPTPAMGSRARRRVNRTPSYAASNAGTEYTTASTMAPLDSQSNRDMSRVESVSMKSFANWCTDNIKDDPTYAEILNSAADEHRTLSELSKAVVNYIRIRKESDSTYDSYDELTDPDSASSVWIRTQIRM